MPDIKYFLRVASGVSLKRFLHLLDVDKRKSGKSTVSLLTDIARCSIRYGASFNDYMIFSYWLMDHAQRDTILTRVRAHHLFDKVNDPNYVHLFDSKSEFYRNFGKYLGRDTVIVADTTPDEFDAFFASNPVILAKPDRGWSGKGMKRLELADYPTSEDRRALFTSLASSGIGVIDAWVKQHPTLDELNPRTVNTMRMCTFVIDGHADFLYAALKAGAGDHFVDNLESGGIHSPVDPETGKLFYAGRNSQRDFTDTSPATGVPLVGFEVPYFHEAVAMVQEASMVVPQVRYVGWDVAITPTGPVLIEGNAYPGDFFWQLPQYGPRGAGLWPYFTAHVPGL